jgi:hypothetical protein
MRQMIGAQRDVMLQYLGAPAGATAVYVPQEVVAMPVPAIEVAPVVAAPVVAAPVAPPSTLQLAITIVSERTGYPVETLGLDLDLEADLSIDSIKRIEIIGELAARLGLRVQDGGASSDAVVEELATRKTLRGLVEWLDNKVGTGAATATEAATATATETATATATETATATGTATAAGTAPATAAGSGGFAAQPTPAPAASPIPRFVLDLVPAPAPANGTPATALAGKRVGVVGGGAIAAALAARLTAEGANVRLAECGDPLVNGHAVDALIHLGALDAGADPLAAVGELFERVREVAVGGAALVLVATGHGGHLGRRAGAEAPLLAGGPSGVVKTLAAEYPAIRARIVDLDPALDPDAAAGILHGELHAGDPVVEVGYADGVRSTLALVPAAAPAEPAGGVELDPDAVVVITGGARGITARIAIAIAERYRCAIELIGRSPAPEGDEDPELAGAADAPALRRFLIERTGSGTAVIEAQVQTILADRDVRRTLAAVRAAGGRPTYHAVDVRTPAFGALIEELYRSRGRIDGVIHGAGILDDKLIRDKTPESFARVFATKVAGARTLAERLRKDVRFVALFASVSGAFGNRGQVDYAAANDALDKLALSLSRRVDGRVVALDWGPWAGAGMVSPALAREYARRGIDLIDVERGVAAFLAELRGGARDAQVILTAVDPRTFATRPAPGAPAAARSPAPGDG